MTELETYPDVVERVRIGMEEVRYLRPTPKSPRRRRVLRVTLAVGAVLAIVLISTQVQAPLGTPTQEQTPPETTPVLWAAVPEEATQTDIQAATVACQNSLDARDPNLDIGLTKLPPLVILDIRGNRALASFREGNQYVACLVDTASDPWVGAIWDAELRSIAASAGLQLSYSTVGDGKDAISFANGTVGPSVAKVVFEFGLSGLRTGEATLREGAFSIWWPGAYYGGTVRALSASGFELNALTFWVKPTSPPG